MLSFLFLLAFPVLQIAAYDNTKMLCLVNKERSKNGLQPLGLDSKLTQAAQQHSNDQARRRTMSHDGGDGSTPSQRVTRAGFNWKSVAENVAYGYKDETECMKQWMNSPGHRRNILGSYEMFGSAVALSGSTPYYTQDFGTDSGGKRNVPKCDGTDYSNGNDNGQNDNNQKVNRKKMRNDNKNNNNNNYGNDNKNDNGGSNDNNNYDNGGSDGNNGSRGNRRGGRHGGNRGQRGGNGGRHGNRGGRRGGNYGGRSSGSYGGRSSGSYGASRTWSFKY